jgi:eukaryotic-like serine/threonine-protein kinase
MAMFGPDSHRLERLGEYSIHRVIGEGGMGIVYEATERLSGRRVALKVLHSNLARSDGARDRFFSEMRIMAGLEHPNIVRSLASAEIDGKLAIALEFIEGCTLREELARVGRLSVSRTITIASAVAAALASAHGASAPVVHRDLKPENLMLASDGRIKVMDFGVAKVLGDGPGHTHTTQAVGTVQYMSPEQAGGGTISPQTDLYALGLLIYEMLGGRPPFESPSLLAVLRHHCETPPPPLPDDVRQRIPLGLEQLMLELLEKSPAARPASALSVLQRLMALAAPLPAGASQIVAATTEPRGARGAAAFPLLSGTPNMSTLGIIERLEAKRRWPLALGAIASVLVVGAAAAFFLLPRDASSKRSKASAEDNVPGCGENEFCAPFRPATPQHMEAEAIIAEATKLARSVDPAAKLYSASFSKGVDGGFIDLTRPSSNAMLQYNLSSGGLFVRVSPTSLVAMRIAPGISPPSLPEGLCSLRRAWDAAGGAGVGFDEQSWANLQSLPSKPGPLWLLSVRRDTILIDAVTCARASTF